LVKMLGERLGGRRCATAWRPGGRAAAPAAVEEQTDLRHSGATGANKINVIKAVREVTSPVSEAKDWSRPPIKEGVNKEEAAAIQKKFTEAGATVEVK
jgi:large subunit ribosomal protein L7/L12